MSKILFILCMHALFCVIFAYTDKALEDRITNLPGAELLDINFNQFSGYLSIPGLSNSSDSKHMHYWFTESQNDPANDPISFWTNGGPGCSGLLGALMENGPFRVQEDMTLALDKYSWNTVSNMVFIESPCGVGFSYSNDKANYNTGDDQTAQDNWQLIQAFMERFPSYRSNDLYLSSESYGGHYLPTWAKKIVDKNAKVHKSKVLNFKGFAVGNPYTDVNSGTPSMIETWWGHQIVSKPMYDQYKKCVKKGGNCWDIIDTMYASLVDMNLYALDYPVCTSGSSLMKDKYSYSSALYQQREKILRHQEDALNNRALSSLSSKSRKLEDGSYEFNPCDYMTAYLNLDTVKSAFHVKTDITWTACSDNINYSSKDGKISTAPIYNYLIDGGYDLSILVYSGDDDSVCGTVGTQDWIYDLGYKVESKYDWLPYKIQKQTAGFITKWKDTKLAFVTVRNAGHEVPFYQPEIALSVWKKFLAGDYN